MDRRSIVKLISSGVSLAVLSGVSFPVEVRKFWVRSKALPNKALSYLLLKYPMEKTDKNPGYLSNHDFTKWHNEIHPYLKSLTVPGDGKIVELGVHRGVSSTVLKKKFGAHRYMGVDSMPYCNDPQVVKTDIRSLENLAGETAALVWNDISTWEGSPRGRLKAFEWAKQNLKIGGVYIDEGAYKIPLDLDFSDFELLHKGINFTVFKKIS